jgi:glyoxylase-like metal-dependent hydrolase (beta-lactamase superfamily II)
MESRSVSIPASLALVLALSTAAQAQGGFGPPKLTLVPVEGKENIYLIRNQFAGNITVLVGEEGVVLVDTKSAQDHAGVIDFVSEVTEAPVKYVINTHLHPDHTGGNPPLKALGLPVVASENARRIMAERSQPGLPDITLRDTLTATQDMVREMNAQQRSREEIQAMLQSEFDWGGLEMQIGLDGVIAEMR